MFYSPFENIKNIFELDNLAYSDLGVLETITERYYIEYKSEYNDKFKEKKLPKTISAFANTFGGWLFIGVDDSGKLINIDLSTIDEETIYRVIASRVTPTPIFHVRTLRDVNDKNKGVIAIYVEEGKNLPYVANGGIYVRNGKESIPAERATLDLLIKQSLEHSDLSLKCVNCQNNEFRFSQRRYINDLDDRSLVDKFTKCMQYCSRVDLYIQNNGKHNDENIELTIRISNLYYFDLLREINKYPNSAYEEILGRYVSLNVTENISTYVSPKVFLANIPPVKIPSIYAATQNDIEYEKDYMKYLFNLHYGDFEICHTQSHIICKIIFKEINPGQKMFLPSSLLLLNGIDKIEYSITSKYSMERINGILKKNEE